MKEKFIRFMQGRYGGADKLNSHLMYLLFILVIIELFTGSKPLMILSLFLMFYIYFRMFSKNIYKRYAENQKYVQLIAPITKKVVSKCSFNKGVVKIVDLPSLFK